MLEREPRLLAVHDEAHHDVARTVHDMIRDERVNDALWALVDGDVLRARDRLGEARAIDGAVPFRAGRIEAFVDCALRENERWPSRTTSRSTPPIAAPGRRCAR